MKMIFQCEDNMDGIFTAIYDAWSSGLGHNHVKLEVLSNQCRNFELFSEYTVVITDTTKAAKVARAIQGKISDQAYEMVIRAAASESEEKADVIYRFLVLGFKIGRNAVHYLSNEAVSKIFEINRFVANEVHFYLGFLRFEELENQVLIAKYEPKSDLTSFIMPHFTDRMNQENFIIFDVGRSLAGIHQKNYPWVMVKIKDTNFFEAMNTAERELEYKNLWLTFFNSIGVESRENPKLQRNMLRIHYRKYMTEFMAKNRD